MRRAFVLFLLGAAVPTGGAQVIVRHDAGVVIPGDFDKDGRGDFVVLPGNEPGQVYFGRAAAPWIVAGPTWTLPTSLRWDLPLVRGRHLYVAKASPIQGHGDIDVFRIATDGQLQFLASHALPPLGASGRVLSAKLAPLARDLDRDGEQDLIVVWTETPAPPSVAAQASYVVPTGLVRATPLPRPPGQPDHATIAALLPVQNLLRQEATFLAAFSSATSVGGFGVFGLGDGPRLDGAQWIGSAPPLFMSGLMPSIGTTTAGFHTPIPQLFSVTLKLQGGRSIHVVPFPVAPYIQPAASWIETSDHGNTLAQCTHDFDGDGRDEMVWVETTDGRCADLLVVADPGQGRSYIQGFWLSPAAPAARVQPLHGALVDFDGDGAKDLVVTAAPIGASGSMIFLFRCDRSAGPGKPALVRV
jgi:hypothetical protein